MKLNSFTVAIRCLSGLFPPKLLLVMKITTVLIMIVLVQASAKSYSQVTLNEKNAPLEKVLKSIEKQTGYSFFYNYNNVKNAVVSIQVSNTSLDQALAICFKDLPISFKIIDKNVVLTKKEEPDKIPGMAALLPVDINGTVVADDGLLAGVSVSVKGTNRVTSTNDKGAFFLRDIKENDILVFAYVGYKTQEIIVKNNAVINVKLEKAITGLNDVVVVGYGTTQRKDLTGAVSTVDAKDVEDVPFNTIDNALAGKAAGVQVTKTDGSPGGAVRIRIRGSSSLLGGNDPLYVIDGVPLQVQSNFISPGYTVGDPVANAVAGGYTEGNNAGLSTAFVNGLNSLGGLNVDDIESITILKDASSTAIYGSKAANGVVIITTKRGKKDMKPQITASYYSTVSSPETPKLLNASQYKMLLTEAAQNDYDMMTSPQGVAEGFGPGNFPANTIAILNDPSSYFGTDNTNWIKEVTRTTISNNAELSVQGGGNSSKYFSSIAYNNTPGVVDATGSERVSGKINLENDIGTKFRFITNIILGYTDQDIGDGAYSQALRARPDWGPYDANGNFVDFNLQDDAYSRGFLNPVALLTATNNAKTFSMLGSVSGIYDITKDMQFKSAVSLNMQDYNQRNYMPSYLDIGGFYGNVANSGGIGGNSNSRMANWFIENTLTYTKQLDKNNRVDILAGQSYEADKTSYFSATATGYPNDNVLTSLSSAVTPLIVTGDDPSEPQSYLLSFYVRANYSLMDKYLFTFTGRTDGSSKFGPDNKFGYFPSGAIAWRISQENFLKNIKWIDDIKFRGSYGLTGTQNIGNQMYRTLYSPLSFGGSSALVPTQLGNQGIKWESTTEADAGIDVSLFNDRLTATVDYYNKQTSGDLLSLPVASSSSYSSVLTNAVGIRNRGVEVTLGGDIIRTQDFKWSASVNVTWNSSIVTKLSPNADLSQIGSLTGLESFGSTVTYGTGNVVLIQGQPLGLITGEIFTGIIKTQAQLAAYNKELGPLNLLYGIPLSIGDPMFKLDPSTAAQGEENPYTNQIIGHGAPKYYGGITQGFTYKKFDLQLYFTYSEGGQLLWGDHVSSMGFIGTGNANVIMLNRYTPTNTNTDLPRLILNHGQYTESNLDVFNSSYLKLRTLTLNYHVDKTLWMQKAGMKTASIFVSATNLFTITKYPGNDPETSDDSYSVGGGYLDVSNYPSVKTFSLGLKVGF